MKSALKELLFLLLKSIVGFYLGKHLTLLPK